MNKILSIDPSGTGTSGCFFTNGTQSEFHQFQAKEWKAHLAFIIALIKAKQPIFLLYEDTNYISQRTKDGLSLFRLLGALEALTIVKETINVLKVKGLYKQILAGQVQIEGLTYQIGRGKGWIFQGKRISIHCLDALLIYHLWKKSQ